MAEPLKNRFGEVIPRTIGEMIQARNPRFDAVAFVREAMKGYEPLNLMARGKKIARALRSHLSQDYPCAIEVLIGSLGPRLESSEEFGMTPFLYLPHLFFVAEYGLDHFEESMRAQYELTQRFTAEFSIRPFIERYQTRTLARLEEWASDANVHVRRLVSEGTRPRLPWASRLREFQRDPAPVIKLLELLKDDPELYVRRSVANSLNDIGKDNPQTLVAVARRWMKGASAEREWLVHHALRSAVKRAEPGALRVLGFGGKASVALERGRISPRRVRVGESVTIAFELKNSTKKLQRVLVDFKVFFVKANGRSAPKVFKLKQLSLAPGDNVRLSKRVSLAPMTTRRHFAGAHRVEVIVNGEAIPLGSFTVQ